MIKNSFTFASWLSLLICFSSGCYSVREDSDDGSQVRSKDDEPLPPLPGDRKIVSASGIGRTREEARKVAIRHAIDQAVGVLIRGVDYLNHGPAGDVEGSTTSIHYRGFYEGLEGEEHERILQNGDYEIQGTYIIRVKDVRRIRNQPPKRFDGESIGQVGVRLDVGEGNEQAAADFTRQAFGDFDFPMGVLQPEVLPWELVSSDASGLVIDVPVRISVDKGQWSALLDELSENFEAYVICDDHGREPAWSVRQRGWSPMDGARGLGAAAVADARDDALLKQLMPLDQRIGSIFFAREGGSRSSIDLPECMRRDRVLAAAEANGDGVRWWQLPATCWTVVREAVGRVPRLRVRVLDFGGKALATSMDPDGGLRALHFAASQGTSRANVDWSMQPPLRFDDLGRLMIPFGSLRLSAPGGDALVYAEEMTLRFRFRVNPAVRNLRPKDERIVVDWL